MTKNNDLVLDTQYSIIIYKVCYLLPITSFYGILLKKYDRHCVILWVFNFDKLLEKSYLWNT